MCSFEGISIWFKARVKLPFKLPTSLKSNIAYLNKICFYTSLKELIGIVV